MSKIACFPVDILFEESYIEKICILSAASILVIFWGYGKFYFWRQRQKTGKAIAEERKRLRERKEELYELLTNEKVMYNTFEKVSSVLFHLKCLGVDRPRPRKKDR